MQLIAADIGNSSTKIAVDHVAQDDRWCIETVFRGEAPVELATLQLGDVPAFWSVCSVNRNRSQQLRELIETTRPDDQFAMIEADDVALETNVESRTRLGRDRLVAAWMAVQLNDQTGPLVVVDAGTAVTIDLVDEDLVFQGGAIFPGAESNLRQLSQNTDALPDLQQHAKYGRLKFSLESGLGKSTSEAILQGVYSAQIAAVNQIAHALARKSVPHATIYATGGGMVAIEDQLDTGWQFVPDLVLRGAREIGRKLIQRSTLNSPHPEG